MDEERVAGDDVTDEIGHHVGAGTVGALATRETGTGGCDDEHPNGLVRAGDAVAGLATHSIALAFSSSNSLS